MEDEDLALTVHDLALSPLFGFGLAGRTAAAAHREWKKKFLSCMRGAWETDNLLLKINHHRNIIRLCAAVCALRAGKVGMLLLR